MCLFACVCICLFVCVFEPLLLWAQILFVSIDVSQSLPNVLNYFGVSENDVPTARVINMETGKKYKISTEKYTLESMSQLCKEIVDGTAQVKHTQAHEKPFSQTNANLLQQKQRGRTTSHWFLLCG